MTVDVTSFGAVGDGRTDDSAAITRAFGTLRSGQTLRFPGGRTFCHGSVLSLTTANVSLVGPGTLQATAEQTSALQIEAAGVTVTDLTLGVANTTQRWSSPDQHKLFLGPHAGISVRDVSITGSAAVGLFCFGPSNFVLERITVSDTRADGIHLTNGAHDGTVESPSITRSGDDGVAVVSYLGDGSVCHDISIHSPRVRVTTGGRGLSVVGGDRIVYTDIDVAESAAAGVYLACEGGDFVTAPTRGVRVTSGRITGANTDPAIDHGAVLVYSGRSGGSVTDVVVSELSVSGTRSTASRQIGVVADSAADAVSDVRFVDLRLSAEPNPYQGDAPGDDFTLTGVTAAGARVVAPT